MCGECQSAGRPASYSDCFVLTCRRDEEAYIPARVAGDGYSALIRWGIEVVRWTRGA